MTTTKKLSRALAPRREFAPFGPFGNKLVEAGHASLQQLKEARAEVRRTGKSLMDVLQGMTGKELPPQLQRQYKQHHLFEMKILFGIEALDLDVFDPNVEAIAQLLDDPLSLEVCQRCALIPISRRDDPPVLKVGIVNPDEFNAKDQLKLLQGKGVQVQRALLTRGDFDRLMELVQTQVSSQSSSELFNDTEAEETVEVSEDLSELGFASDADLEDAGDEVEGDLAKALGDAQGAPVIKLVNSILIKAIQDGVSDIHVEPQEKMVRVRFRKDGVLQQAFQPLPTKIAPAVAARFKIMADLDIAERRMPQDGRIRRKFQKRNVDFRVSTLPSRFGEKIVLRILDNSSTQLGLDKLITSPETLELVRSFVARPFGLILVTGPTGSGKSTTLYSMLAERNDPGVNISTAEDPIEYSLPGITQVQVLRQKGMNFAAILRSFLRQDPDVILVGETRDQETAKTAIEAALTGHLVLTTLHTNDAAGAIARLDEMGIEPFMVSGALLGVLAQRLMRRVCSKCRVPYTPTQEELARFGLSANKETAITFYKANKLTPKEIEAARADGTLCDKCNGNGYKGRCGVYEVMKMTERLQIAINEGAPTERIKEIAVEEGMVTLLAYSLNLVREGLTTFEEVERVTFTDSGLEAELKAKRKSTLSCRTCGAELRQEWLDCPYCLTPRFTD